MTAERLTLSVLAETRPGSRICVAGSIEQLGRWSPQCSPFLATDPSTYPKWSVTLDTKGWPSGGIEYKFIIIEPEGAHVWENRANRWLSLESSRKILKKTPWFGQVDDPPSPLGEPATPKEDAQAAPPPPLKDLSAQEPAQEALTESHAAAAPVAATGGGKEESVRRKSMPMPKKNRPEEDAPRVSNFRHKRCSSVPHLAGLAEESTGARSEARCPEDGLPLLSSPLQRRWSTSPKSGTLDNGRVVWVPPDAAAESPASVEVVFETNSSKWQMIREDTGDEWSLNFVDTGLEPGVYTFFFLVDGQRALSPRHATAGHRNAALFSGTLRRYLENRGGKQPETVTPMVKWGRSNSVADPTPKGTPFARPHSISHNLAALASAGSSSDEEDLPGASLPKATLHKTKHEPFPEEIHEGLYDASLRLRLHGFVLPVAGSSPSDPPTRPPPRLRFKAGSCCIGKPSGLECEDAYFANEFGLGVADGVGSMVQFARFGVNSAAYAADLMEIAEASLWRSPSSGVSIELRALDACREAEEKSSKYGASTISVMALEGNTVGCANLGDSGFMILRKGPAGMGIVHKSVEQQHSWNCPYQLMRIPPVLAAKFPNFPQDHAADSDTYRHEVEEGDLVLVFSDGMKDNIHTHEILSIVDRSLSPAFASLADLSSQATDPEDIARALAKAAQVRSRDPRARVPFTLYSLEHGYDCLGGKEDDITVVAAWLVPDTDGVTIQGLEE